MTDWIRFERGGETAFGTLVGDAVAVFEGDMFGVGTPTGETRQLADVSQEMAPRGPLPQRAGRKVDEETMRRLKAG